MQLGLFSAGVDYRYVNVVGGVLVGEKGFQRAIFLYLLYHFEKTRGDDKDHTHTLPDEKGPKNTACRVLTTLPELA